MKSNQTLAVRREDLAIHGGSPIRTKPWQDNFTMGEEEKRAALEVLDSGYLSLFEGCHNAEPPFSFWGGPKVQALEEAWAAAYGTAYAVSMNSATSCLSAAVGALELGFGDEIIVSPYTMSACASSVLAYGAIPIFADVQPETGSLNPDSIEAHVTPRTRAILVVHQFGIPAEMDRIMAIAATHRLKVIEDCAQAHGAKFKGRPVGTFGEVGVFSLNVNKAIQTGEGGICITQDKDLRYRLALIRNHGEAVVEAAGYAHLVNLIGFNYRLTELAAAMALEQLKKLPSLNELRVRYVEELNRRLNRHDFLQTPRACPHGPSCGSCEATYYVYPIRYVAGKDGVPRDRLIEMLKAEGIRFYPGYVRPLYLQPLYQKKIAFKHGYPFSARENRESRTNYAPGSCPVAERLHIQEMLINEHVRWPHTVEDMLDIAQAVDKISGFVRQDRSG